MATTAEKHQCEKRVRSEGLWSRDHQCTRKATVQHGGKWYCNQHSPEAVAEREAKSEAAYQQKVSAWRAQYSAGLLLSACKKWLNHYDACVRDKKIGDEPGIAEMRAAVAKAEGRE